MKKPIEECPHCKMLQSKFDFTKAMFKRHIELCPSKNGEMQYISLPLYVATGSVVCCLAKYNYICMPHNNVIYINKNYNGLIQFYEYVYLASEAGYTQTVNLIIDLIETIEKSGATKKKECSPLIESIFCCYNINPFDSEFNEVDTVYLHKYDIQGCDGLNNAIDVVFKKLFKFKFTRRAAIYNA